MWHSESAYYIRGTTAVGGISLETNGKVVVIARPQRIWGHRLNLGLKSWRVWTIAQAWYKIPPWTKKKMLGNNAAVCSVIVLSRCVEYEHEVWLGLNYLLLWIYYYLFQAFTGYSMHGSLIHLTSEMHSLYPADGGVIQEETYNFIHGKNVVIISIQYNSYWRHQDNLVRFVIVTSLVEKRFPLICLKYF